MEEPNTHGITKFLLKLNPGEYRLIVILRGVPQKNKNQAEHHWRVCKNNELEKCKCHSIQ